MSTQSQPQPNLVECFRIARFGATVALAHIYHTDGMFSGEIRYLRREGRNSIDFFGEPTSERSEVFAGANFLEIPLFGSRTPCNAYSSEFSDMQVTSPIGTYINGGATYYVAGIARLRSFGFEVIPL